MLTSDLHVENMTSPNTGKPVANQFIITDNVNDIVVFQSYDSPIIELDFKKHIIYVFENWDYSVTTSKYRNAFMKMYVDSLDSKQELGQAMNDGDFAVPSTSFIWQVMKMF